MLDSGMVAWVGGRDCGWSGAEGTGASEAVGPRLAPIQKSLLLYVGQQLLFFVC